MKFYFIRHGQTTCNLTGTHQGWGPIRLSEKGRSQAAAAHEKLKDVEFDKYYCSDLMRTKQTAEIIFPEIFHNGGFIFDEDLREIDTGTYFGVHPDELRKLYGDEYERRRSIMDLGIFGVESSEHLKARVRNFRKTLEAEAEKSDDPEKKYAIVTHGGIIRTFALMVSGLPDELIDTLPAGIMRVHIKNCSVCVFSYTPGDGWLTEGLGL